MLAKGNAVERNALRTQLPDKARTVTLTAYDTQTKPTDRLFVKTTFALLVSTQGKSPVR